MYCNLLTVYKLHVANNYTDVNIKYTSKRIQQLFQFRRYLPAIDSNCSSPSYNLDYFIALELGTF